MNPKIEYIFHNLLAVYKTSTFHLQTPPPWGCTTYANAAGRANITSFQQLHIVHARCRSWPCTCYRFTWKLLAATFRRNDYKWVTGYANVSFSRSACDNGRESGVVAECHRQRAPLVSYVFRRRLLGEDTLQMRLKVVQENSESFCSSCILSVVSCNFNISSWARSTVQHAATYGRGCKGVMPGGVQRNI